MGVSVCSEKPYGLSPTRLRTHAGAFHLLYGTRLFSKPRPSGVGVQFSQYRPSTAGPSRMASCRKRSARSVNLSPIFLAGTPAWISYDGTLLVTTEPAPMIAPRPILTPAMMMAPNPTHASSSITVSSGAGRPEKMIGTPGFDVTWSFPIMAT